MTQNKVLIIDEMHLSIIPLLEAEGFVVNYRPEIKREEILTIVSDYIGLIIRSKTPMDRALLEKAVNLKFIGRAGAGLDQIDLEFLEEKGIQLHNAPEGNRDAVGEHAIGGLLSLFNHINRADGQVRNGVWDREGNRGEELAGKTVGVFGFGNMGQAFAKKLRGFDVKILAYDKYKKGIEFDFVEEVAFEQILDEADVLSIHVPLTAETRNYFGLDLLQKFSKPIYLINTARGEVISFETLNKALDLGILKGAVLDVLENEKFKIFTTSQKEEFEKLTVKTNVLFSPHVAGWTFQSYEKINQVLVDKISQKK